MGLNRGSTSGVGKPFLGFALDLWSSFSPFFCCLEIWPLGQTKSDNIRYHRKEAVALEVLARGKHMSKFLSFLGQSVAVTIWLTVWRGKYFTYKSSFYHKNYC